MARNKSISKLNTSRSLERRSKVVEALKGCFTWSFDGQYEPLNKSIHGFKKKKGNLNNRMCITQSHPHTAQAQHQRPPERRIQVGEIGKGQQENNGVVSFKVAHIAV